MGGSKDRILVCLLGMFLLLCGVILWVPSSLTAAGYDVKQLFDASAYDTDELKRLMNDTRSRADMVDNQIKSIRKDIDWLILKVNRIMDSGRKPHSSLSESVTAKENRVSILKKEKSRLSKLNAFYTNEYKARQKKRIAQKQENSKGDIIIDSRPVKAKIKASVSKPQVPGPSVKRASIDARIKKYGLADWIEISGDNTCLRINTTLPILFSSGSARVAKEYRVFLKKLALLLKPYDIKVLVNGYADTDPIHTKQYPSNLELGASRAANIVRELVKNGLKPSIFKIGTTGEYRFAAKQPLKKKSFQRRAQVTVIFTG